MAGLPQTLYFKCRQKAHGLGPYVWFGDSGHEASLLVWVQHVGRRRESKSLARVVTVERECGEPSQHPHNPSRVVGGGVGSQGLAQQRFRSVEVPLGTADHAKQAHSVRD